MSSSSRILFFLSSFNRSSGYSHFQYPGLFELLSRLSHCFLISVSKVKGMEQFRQDGKFWDRDCREYHVHSLLGYIPVVLEAIEAAGELTSLDEDHNQKRRLFWSRKYHQEWNDPRLFQWRFGKRYLVSPEFCS
ncbi:hypothetical protein Ancab_037963 [Ancistrocladus abbreviatus]